jgi:hypothetical protein
MLDQLISGILIFNWWNLNQVAITPLMVIHKLLLSGLFSPESL